MFTFELSNKVVHKAVVKVLTTQVGVAGGGLDLEDALLDGEERNIKGATTKIEDENVALALNLLVETIGNGSSGGLVDDTEDVETGNGTSVLGGKTLRVIEVGRDTKGWSADRQGSAGERTLRLPFSPVCRAWPRRSLSSC